MAAARGNIVVSAEVPKDLSKRLDDRAAQEGRTRANALKAAILFWLENSEPMAKDQVHPVRQQKARK